MHRGIRRLGAGEKKTARLTAYLDTADCDYTLSDPTTEQIPEVPVLLEDNAVARSMNCITEQYSLPAYDGVDPNPVMAPFFILFFRHDDGGHRLRAADAPRLMAVSEEKNGRTTAALWR